MSNDVNHIVLSGNVGQVPEIISMPDKTILAKLTLASNKRWKHEGNSYAKAEWHTILFFGKLAEAVKSFVGRGDKLLIQGELCYKQWQDKNETTHTSAEIRVKEFTILRSNSNRDVPESASVLSDTYAKEAA